MKPRDFPISAHDTFRFKNTHYTVISDLGEMLKSIKTNNNENEEEDFNSDKNHDPIKDQNGISKVAHRFDALNSV